MNHLQTRLASLTLLCWAAAMPALAASSAASSASDSVSTSVGSVSDSIKKSSESSTGKKDVADGDYRVIDVAAAADRPGFVRVQLQALADATAEGGLDLFVPQATVAQGQLAVGQVVTARNHDYGVEFAKAETRQAFFLAMNDAWHHELKSRPVTL